MGADISRARPVPRRIVARLLIGPLLAVTCVLVAPTPHVGAQQLVQELPRPELAAWFGYSVAVDGATIVVGAKRERRAYVFQRLGTTYSRVAELSPTDSSDGDGFGSAVAIAGDTIVVGSANAMGNPSKAYVFITPNGFWSGTVTESVVLHPRTANSQFGRDVAVANPIGGRTTVVVTNGSRAHVYEEPAAGWPAWTFETAVINAFAWDVDIDENGTTVVVAGTDEVTFPTAAKVFVRPGTGWGAVGAPTASLQQPDGHGFHAVAIDGSTIVGGAPMQDVNGARWAGAAYVFQRSGATWVDSTSPAAVLRESDPALGANFGGALDIDEGTIVVGQISDTDTGLGVRFTSVHRFVRPLGGWQGTMTATEELDAAGRDAQYGKSVAVDDATIVVGDPAGGAGAGNNDGKAWVFLNDVDNDAVPDDNDNCRTTSNNDQADFDGDRLGDACDDDDDGDGAQESHDNCPWLANPDQADLDADRIGDACDDDDDGDGAPEPPDNCAGLANPDQADLDGDGQGDPCDPDDDGDGVPDTTDLCPVDPNPTQSDADRDGVPDVCDRDGTLSIGDHVIVEGDSVKRPAKLAVTLSSPLSHPVSVHVSTTIGGSATLKRDYVGLSNRFTIPAGNTVVLVPVNVVPDLAVEASETVVVTLSAPSGAGIADGTATVTIVDDDAAGASVAASVSDPTVHEPTGGTTTASFTVSFETPLLSSRVIRYTTRNVSARGTLDYTAFTDKSLQIPAGAVAAFITVPVVGDGLAELPETFELVVIDAGSLQTLDVATATILDDDAGRPDAPQITVGKVEVPEPDSGSVAVTVPIHFSSPLRDDTVFQWNPVLMDGVDGSDVGARVRSFTVKAGSTSASVTLTLFGDTSVESRETVGVAIAPTGSEQAFWGFMEIVDNDPRLEGATSFAVGAITVHEGDSGARTVKVPVVLPHPAGEGVGFDWTLVARTATAAGDFKAARGSAPVAFGKQIALIPVTIVGDGIAEPDEILDVLVDGGPGIGTLTATVTIVDDDPD